MIANTADDTWVHGLHVSPDPDLVTYWLAGEIDEERGWGIRDDTFTVHERLERLGAPGLVPALRPRPRDLPVPNPLRAEGGTLTAAQGQIARALGVARRRAADVRGAGADQGADAGRLAWASRST